MSQFGIIIYKIKNKHKYLHHFTYINLIVCILVISSCKHKSEFPFSESAEKALSTFELESGFKIELVAAEPLIADPVAMEIDESGRMYVVEMHGYPLDINNTGKIKLLSDTDGDGKMDKSIVFADSLILPTGIMRWKKGILVTDAPNVLYLEDTNGDGKADIRNIMLKGFALSNPQHNVNSPLLGLDNWIYLSNEGTVTTTVYKEKFGDSGQEILYPQHPSGPRLPPNGNGLNVRFRPDSHELALLSSKSQFGQTFDAWGHHLLVSNSNHIYQEAIDAKYLNRNPNLLISKATQSISDHGNSAEVFPITINPEHQLLTDVGVITSACGITAYLGGAFPPEYDNATFVAEPVSNIVHADRLKTDGASFSASRLREGKEFLASTDSWFRPVNMYIGPDGALYIIDYYRQIIEHPEWMAEEVIKSGDLYNGKDKGRIYRITPENAKPATWTENLEMGKFSNEQLITKLEDPNIWWRRNAQRLLVDKNSNLAVPALIKMAQSSTSPLGRLHALWTLKGMNKLSITLIRKALRDSIPGIRENAIKLAEFHLDVPKIVSTLLTLQNDDDPKVRYQLLCTLGFIDSPQAAEARQKLLFLDVEDKWVQIAALSAPSSQITGLLDAVLARFREDIPAYESLTQRLSAMVGANQQPEKMYELLMKATASGSEKIEPWQAAVLEGLAQGLKSKKPSSSAFRMEQKLLVKAFFEHPSSAVRQASLNILQVIGFSDGTSNKTIVQKAKGMAENVELPAEQRAQAINFMALRNPVSHTSFLEELINPGEPLPVQLAALKTLSTIPDETVSLYILHQWPSLTPEIRDAALNTFMSSPERISLLLDAVEGGKIKATNVGWSRSVSMMAGRWPRSTKLMTQADLDLRDRARTLLSRKGDKRKDVIKEYQAALNLNATLGQGKIVFQQNCAVCHQMGEKLGSSFGPDLTSIRNRQPASIMRDILDPNLSIADGFDLWSVELKTGESVQGIISSETPATITLRNIGGHTDIIARKDIRSLKTFETSAMPVGLEMNINPQEMADLLAFIRQEK